MSDIDLGPYRLGPGGRVMRKRRPLEVEIANGVCAIRLNGDKAEADNSVALIDEADLALIAPYSWHIREGQPRRSHRHGPYASSSFIANGRVATIGMHALITGWPMTDHENHNGLDNRRSNLRPATRSENGGNRRQTVGGTSPYKGVCWSKEAHCWRAAITVNRNRIYLGRFPTDVEAARAYDIAALEAWGEFAFTNFPAADYIQAGAA